MMEFKSSLGPKIQAFVTFQVASGKMAGTYEYQMHSFDRLCAEQFPLEQTFVQEMVDFWCVKRNTERGNSFRNRIYPIHCFYEYLLKSERITQVQFPELPIRHKAKYIPHFFTEDELATFFHACDTLEVKKSVASKFKSKTLPVLFRLLYSSGLRPLEARMLCRTDVDLFSGVVNVKISKGPNQHFIVLHDSMKNLMTEYDRAIEKIIPERTYFFQIYNSGCITRHQLRYHFRKIWNNCGFSKAVVYDLRHCYAITNINKWKELEVEENSKFVYLSKSMGHSNLENTRYYYSLTPNFIAERYPQIEVSFNSIVPEVIL